ncbi:hypothetical protein Pan153_49750 [Gimesia panareensis]|uniref:Uncharacterized protein n=1 Tax=Gimesia panareensis TaxID=2527978 RepID=A0A518FVG5_9PLAN|nr:hypothetical protein Pan153_49750 [Gimesia panareensis]
MRFERWYQSPITHPSSYPAGDYSQFFTDYPNNFFCHAQTGFRMNGGFLR